jgi:hypothetical protein
MALVEFTYGGGQNGGDSVRLELAYHQGWKIDEITNSKGQTFSAAMESALRQ